MFKELKGMEYILEILRLFNQNPGVQYETRELLPMIQERIEASPSYLAKILQRMVKLGMLSSSDHGYTLAKDVATITPADVMEICDMPTSPRLYDFCNKIKIATSQSKLGDYYDI